MMSGELQAKRIFIIEDKPGNLAVMKTLLENSGALVNFDRWGVDTLQRLEAFAPVDVILLDLMFPGGLTGYDIFDSIKASGSFNDVRIVAVSASEPSEAIPATRARGFAGFIAKPISFNNFCTQVASIINGQAVWNSGMFIPRG
ncbi:MAG: response regulator [Anaerolineae bacterium]|nr:response regulator [Anaerolineae bacterium]